MTKYKIGELVIYFTEVCEYLGYEEHEDDNYHKLLSLERGEILVSACIGPDSIKDSKDYDRIQRFWNFSRERTVESHEETKEFFKKILSKFKTDNIEVRYYIGDKLAILDVSEWDDFMGYKWINAIKLDEYKMFKDEDYRNMILNYIEQKIKNYEQDCK